MNNATILIIDDEKDILKLLSMSLSRMGYTTLTASNLSEASDLLISNKVSLCITDKNLPDGDGLDFIKECQIDHPNMPIAMITAYGSMDTAIDAMKAGAFDFLPKPVNLDSLKKLIENALKSNTENNDQIDYSQPYQIIGQSAAIKILKEQIQKVAKNLAPVYIQGESGSGKELVARMVHNNSSRSDKPFIAVNCGAIPSELMESEFFGHKKGSFTGANADKIGLFQAAEGGTLFLDEIADLPLSMQVKLLRTLQEKSIRSVGSSKEEAIDVRILSASHKDLQNEIHSKRFREDLYYRINVIDLQVPSLRQRSSDISLLSDYLLQKISKKYELPSISISDTAILALEGYDFPGNVRELENIIERAVALCENNTIEESDLQFGRRSTPIPEPVTTHHSNSDFTQSDNNIASSSSAPSFNIEDAIGQYDQFIENIERTTIEMALEKTRWNKTQAAELLGISFRTLRYKVSKLKIK